MSCACWQLSHGRARLKSHVGVIGSVDCPRDETCHDVTRTQPHHLDDPHPVAVYTTAIAQRMHSPVATSAGR